MLRRIIALAVGTALLTGCSASVTPRQAVRTALAQPEVARWYAEHSAPIVLQGMAGKDAKRWRRYRPAATVDLMKQWLQVKLDADFGPAPHHLEVLVDRATGEAWRRPASR